MARPSRPPRARVTVPRSMATHSARLVRTRRSTTPGSRWSRWAGGGSRCSRGPPRTGKCPVVRGDQVGPQYVEGRPPPFRCPLPCDAHPFGLVTRARRTGWRQERRIGLDQEPIGRHDGGHVRRHLLAAPKDKAGEADGQAEVDHLTGIVERTGVRVDDRGRTLPEGARPGRTADACGAELCDERVLGVAPAVGRSAMEDRRLAGLERESQVASEVGQLVRDRAEDAVVVEPGLADRHDPRVGGPADDPRPAGVIDLGRVVGVDPDRGIKPRETIDAPERALRRGNVPARDEDALKAGQTGRPDDLVRVGLEPVRVQVAVGIDQPTLGSDDVQGRSVSTSSRGKSGTGAAMRPVSPAWAPQASSSRIGGPPLPSGPYQYGWPSCPRRRGAVPGRKGAATRPTRRHASTRSPRTPRRRSSAPSSPAFQALARTHGCSASTTLLALPTYSHSAARASWSTKPSSLSRYD